MVDVVSHKIWKNDARFKDAISVQERLAINLTFLGGFLSEFDVFVQLIIGSFLKSSFISKIPVGLLQQFVNVILLFTGNN